MKQSTSDQYYEQLGKERYERWKAGGGCRPAWLDAALLRGSTERLTDWEPAFYRAYVADHPPEAPPPPASERKVQGEIVLPDEDEA